MVGKTLGKYRIVEKIGRGGMGVVYRGVDETLDREVAIKAISPELVEDDLVRRFRAEAVTLARVNHPNIATVFELFRDGEQLLMVMELVSGQTFEQLIDRAGPLSVERAASLTGQILDALGHAHRAGIVHRDLKPANLMLTDAGIVKVMDFGIARVSGTERMTNDGFMVGTPAYMAPEQVRGEEVDGRTDLYAVGVVFYRLVTGKLPFKADTAVAMIHSQLNDAPTPAREIRSELPDWLDAVLLRSLNKKPADRYQTAEEFRGALDSLDALGALAPLPDDVTIATPAAGMAVHTPVAAAATPAAAPHSTTTLVLSGSHLAVAAAFGAMLLIVIGLLGWLALRRPPDTPVQVVTIPAPMVVPAVTQAAPVSPRPAAPRAAPVAAAAPTATKPAPAQTVETPPAAETPAAASRGAAVVPVDAAPTLLGMRGGRRGGRGPMPLTANGEFAPFVVRDLHAVAVISGRGSRIVDAIVAFSERSITASDSRNGFNVKSFLYAAVTHATLSRSRKPRTTGGASLDLPGGLQEGSIFARGPRLWLTIETSDDRLVLRLEPPQVRPLLDIVAQRTKVPIERYMEPEP
jgi:eukaryotic-like serine/threonine-protein kinase